LRVTVDTNVLDLACRPERFPKDPRQAELAKVHSALKSGVIEGFYSVTMLTVEGIMKKDRAAVFAGTTVTSTAHPTEMTKRSDLPKELADMLGDGDFDVIATGVTLRASQPQRAPLHPEVVARIQAAKALGVRVLHDVPRIGAFGLTDPTGEYYLDRGEGTALSAWIDKAFAVSREIEARGLGFTQLSTLGVSLASGPESTWFAALDKAADVHQRRQVERAFAEWADGDSLAAHVAYGIDIFCSADVGKSNATNSVLDPANRAWLSNSYGVRFMTFEDLAATLP
jgi:hypothetical protein